MPLFLAKTEPSDYSIDNLEQDGSTSWTGVKNPQAINTIKTMKIGDRILIYHSGGRSSIVGLAEITSEPTPDPKIPKSYFFNLKFIKKFPTPITLKQIKSTNLFNDWALIRQSRLSTMPVPPEFEIWFQQNFNFNLTS